MTPPVLTDAEKTVCTTLSWLFLDTELSPRVLDTIVSTLKGLNMPIPTLEHILRYDLFPILFRNLLCVWGGEWCDFDEKWLLDEVERGRMTNPVLKTAQSLLGFVVWHSLGAISVKPTWNEIKEKLQSKTWVGSQLLFIF
jgi:hypothetical protein